MAELHEENADLRSKLGLEIKDELSRNGSLTPTPRGDQVSSNYLYAVSSCLWYGFYKRVQTQETAIPGLEVKTNPQLLFLQVVK